LPASVRFGFHRAGDSAQIVENMRERSAQLPRRRADIAIVSDNPTTPAAPAAGDVVEIVHRISGARVTAVVESASGGPYVLRYDRGSTIPDEAHVRWFDGDTAWQAISALSVIDDTSAGCELAPASEWEPAPVRRSLRAPVDNSPMLVKITSSSVLAKGRRVHAVCLDISDSGCRASWPGRTPLVGDAVDVAWDVGDWEADAEPGWVSARVARIVALPFGARQVGFTFEIADADQASRVREWHQAWLHQHRQRLLDQRSAA
jgi:hypothetical protein